MTTLSINGTSAWRALSLGVVLAGALTAASHGALAGECPADKVGVDVTKPGATEPAGVTDEVLSSIDLDQKPGFEGNLLRLRKLVVQPGGVVPWHSHGERAANIYIISGEITEFRSSCAVPIVHKAGDAIPEFGALSHWWKNESDKPTVLISADLFHDGMTDDHMM